MCTHHSYSTSLIKGLLALRESILDFVLASYQISLCFWKTLQMGKGTLFCSAKCFQLLNICEIYGFTRNVPGARDVTCLGYLIREELTIIYWIRFFPIGQNLVSESSFEVQEVVEKWRNSPRATCGLQWVSSLPFSASLRGMGLSTESKNEQCKLGSAAKQQSSEPNCAFLFGKLFLVFINELSRTSAAQHTSTAPSQCSNECWDNILNNDFFFPWRIMTI